MEGDDAKALREQLAAQTAAVAALTAAVTALTSGGIARPAVHPSITIASLFESFAKVHAGDYSWKQVEQRLRALVRRHGDLPSMSLTPFLWAEHIAKRKNEPTRYERPPKDYTLQLELMRANQLMAFGVANGFLPSNPLAEVKRERVLAERETWLNDEEFLALLKGCDATKGDLPPLIIRAFAILCFDGMLRFEEARGLRRDRIRDGITELSARITKSRRRRTIGFTPRMLQAVADVPVVVGDPRIFVNPATGQLFGGTTLRNWFRDACVASGVDALAADGERVVVHTLRHSGASSADARGAAATAIRDGMGHSTIATTERYLHRLRGRGARDLASIMAKKYEPETDRLGPKAVPRDANFMFQGDENTPRGSNERK